MATTVSSVDWTTSGSIISYQAIGQKFLFNCPAGDSSGNVWGTDTYVSASSVCTAAVHAGKISFSSGGQVTIITRANASSYTGSTKNGVTTYNLSSWTGGSFVFQ